MSSILAHGSTPQTSAFTCNTCGITFVTAELQRQHMKTDWHRYNLKRRVAQLALISSDVFAEKVLSLKSIEEEAEEDEFGFYVHRRRSAGENKQTTKKSLKKLGRLEEMRGRVAQDDQAVPERPASPSGSVTSEFSQFSIKSTEYESGIETGSELNYTESDFTDLEGELEEEDNSDEDVQTEEPELVTAIPITHCFYCGVNNKEKETNIRHMFSKHGLYIPERSFLADLDGLLYYLSEAVSLDHECLVCGFEGKNLESVRQHMTSKGHCRIPYETKDEKVAISEFYNFYEEEIKPKKTNKKVAFAEETEADGVDNGQASYGDSDELDDEDDDDQYNGINDNYTLVHVDRSGVELTLPTGSKIGHRSMARYYRQNTNSLVAREFPDLEKTVALVDRRFSPGLTVHQITKQEKETRRIEQREKNNYHRKTKGQRANFQKHYRDELLGTAA